MRTTQVVKDVENDCKTTSYNDDDSPESGRGQKCIFPFKVYDKKRLEIQTFHKCTEKFCGSHCNNVWCSTQVNETGFHINGKGNWGYCSEECLHTTKSNFVIRDNFAIVESTIGSPITGTTFVTNTSIEKSSKESASIEVAADMEMPKITVPAL